MEARDMSNVSAGGGFIECAGTYNVVIDEIKEGYTEKNTQYYTLILKDSEGRVIRDSYYISDAAAWREALLMDACGLTTEQRKAYVPDMCLGKTVEIVVAPQKDNPQFMQVTKIRQTGVIVTPPAPPAAGDCPF